MYKGRYFCGLNLDVADLVNSAFFPDPPGRLHANGILDPSCGFKAEATNVRLGLIVFAKAKLCTIQGPDAGDSARMSVREQENTQRLCTGRHED